MRYIKLSKRITAVVMTVVLTVATVLMVPELYVYADTVDMVVPTESKSVAVNEGENSLAEDVKPYPDIITENISNRYYYNQLATCDNADKMQKYYNDLLDTCWKIYYGNEDAVKEYLTEVEGLEIYSYYFVTDLYSDTYDLTEHERMIVEDALYDDMPIFYFLYNRTTSQGGDECNYNAFTATIDDGGTTRITIPVANDLFDLDIGIMEYYNGVRRSECRVLIESALHEYYDLVRDVSGLYEKQKIIINEICKNTSYNYDYLMVSYAHNVLGVFEGEKVVCEGYARSVNLIMNYCGIDTISISGYAGELHVWNASKLDDGQWYLSDITWSDRSSSIESVEYMVMNSSAYSSLYVNMPRSAMNSEHNEMEYLPLPEFSEDTTYYPITMHITTDMIETTENDVIMSNLNSTIVDYLSEGICDVIILYDGLDYYQQIINFLLSNRQNIIDEVYKKNGRQYDIATLSYFGYQSNSVWWNGQYDEQNNKIFTMCMEIPFKLKEKVGGYDLEKIYTIDGVEGASITDINIQSICDEFVFPENIEGNNVVAYRNGTSVKECDKVVLPCTLKVLGEGCFQGAKCNSVRLNEGLRAISYDAFVNCANLKSLYIPASVEYIESNAIGYMRDYSWNYSKVEDFVIYGYAGTAAQEYAENNNIKFVEVTTLSTEDKVRVDILNIEECTFELDVDKNTEQTEEYATIKNIISDIVETDVAFTAYEINITDADGNPVKSDGNMKVYLPKEAGYCGELCNVYSVKDDGSLAYVRAWYDDGYMMFMPDELGTYIIVQADLEPDCIIYGDANDDGTINVADAVAVKKYLAGIQVDINLDACDVDGDGKVMISDAVKLMKYLAGQDVVLGMI